MSTAAAATAREACNRQASSHGSGRLRGEGVPIREHRFRIILQLTHSLLSSDRALCCFASFGHSRGPEALFVLGLFCVVAPPVSPGNPIFRATGLAWDTS